MLGDIFTNPGILEMSSAPIDAGAIVPAWGDMLPNRILVIIATVLFIINLPDALRLWPSIVSCIQKAFGNSDLEHSISSAHMRNNTAAILALCVCLIADRFEIYRPQWWSVIPPMWSSCATMGVLALFLLFRRILATIFRPRGIGGEAFATVRHCPWNMFIPLAGLILGTTGLLLLIKPSHGVSETVLLVETGIFYLLSLARTGQILGEHCNGLLTFLYLCALEILPAATLVASAVLF